MFHIVLFEPEIPPNTGNIMRLAANTGCRLHLIEPMAFRLEDKKLRRAGLDYHEYATVKVHNSYSNFLSSETPSRLITCSTKGQYNHCDLSYQSGDYFIFGPESRGLPPEILEPSLPDSCIRIPMQPNSRSLNLSNSVGIIIYEAWRQLGFRLS